MKKYIVLLISIFSILLFSGCRDDYHASEEFQTARYDIEEVSKISVKDICLKQNNSYFGPNVYILDSEEKAVELCTEEYFKGNNKTKINGRKFDIFNFGNFDFRKKAELLN